MLRLGLIAAFVVLCLAGVSYGQVQKGNLLIGGYGSLTHERSSSFSYTNIYLSPTAGIFITDHLAIGMGIPCTFYKYSNSTNRGIGILPFGRYYFLKKEKSSLFVPVSIMISNITYSNSNSINKTVYSNMIGSLGIGYTYFIHPSLGLESSLSYFLKKTTNNIMADPTSKANGFNFFVGLQIYLNRNK